MASSDWSVPIGDERVTTDRSTEVRSPYDGRVLGRVPECGTAKVARAERRARGVLDAPGCPAWKRVEVLDTAARLLAERVVECALTICDEAARPIKTARVEAQRCVSTFMFAAAAARTFV